MSDFTIRPARSGDQPRAYYVCLKTGDHGRDGEPYYRDDPDALGRIFVGPYLAFEPALSLVLEDSGGVCGYALAAFDSRIFYERYEREWRPKLCAEFRMPSGEPATWTRTETVHSWYHRPEYFCPEPYKQYPSHMHIDLLEHARGQGLGRRMMEQLMDRLRDQGSPGGHLAVSVQNISALAFYERLGFQTVARMRPASHHGTVYMGKSFR